MTTTSTEAAKAPYDELATALRGDLIAPGDHRYDEARAVYNAMIDKRPAVIARCRDVTDVIACVRFGRAHGLTIAIRGGGHNAAGLGVWDDALVIDLSLLRSTTVDPGNHTVRVDAGCTWGDVDHATVGFGMATPSGFLASTGVAGLTLGGGIGYLSRRFGLTVDNLLAADVVLADGTFVTASESSHSDLFWALRGGGGNFGVVTSFTFRCHDIGDGGTIIGGPVLYDFADTAAVMRWYRELLPSLPEELSGWIGLITIPPAAPFPEELWGRKSCAIVWCYTGSHDRADEVLEPIKTYGSPLLVGLHPMPFTVLQSAFDGLYPAGLQWYWRQTCSRRSPTRRSTCTASTAHSCRPGTPPCTSTPSTAPPAACRRTRRRSPTGTADGPGSSWVSTPTRPTQASSRSGPATTSYRGNYERLAQVKNRYDPHNTFHVNQNIRPAAQGG